MERRLFLGRMAHGLALALAWPLTTHAAARPLRIGLTPAFLHDRHGLMAEWQAYLEQQLGRPVKFVLRDSYSDTMNLIKQGQLDAAWLCDYPYVLMKSRVRLLATPLNEGRPYYRSYLIVSALDTTTKSITDLAGKVFAYADPFSNTGYLAPRYELTRRGVDPRGHFRKTFFTWSHRKAVEAVALHLADGAAVDSYIWESLAKVEPDLTRRTRVVTRSVEFGFPPFVANNTLAEADYQALRRVLMEMAKNAQGRELLAKLHLDGFIEASPALYANVEEMVRLAGERPNADF